MAEMALVPSLYRKYGSRVLPGQENTAPGITSRFEVFADDTFPEMKVSASTKSLWHVLTIARSIRAGWSSLLINNERGEQDQVPGCRLHLMAVFAGMWGVLIFLSLGYYCQSLVKFFLVAHIAWSCVQSRICRYIFGSQSFG